MSYSEVFGGGSINPAQRTYLSLVSAIDVTLQWPLNAIAGDNVAADIIDADMTVPGLTINFSDARQISNGFTSLVSNVGSLDFTVRDALGGAIVSPVPGTAWFIYLQDNSTEDGTWAIFQLGATMAVADAAALAGAGIKAISTTLNQRIVPTLTGVTPINWVDADRAQFTIWTGGVGVINLPVVATVGSDWFSMARNEGSGILTITPAAGTIDGAATLILNPGDSAIIVTDGVNFFTIGLGGSTTVGFDFVQIDVSGSGDFILSGVQLNRISYQFIGLLTGARKIVVPNTIQQYWADNSTTGAFILEIATAAQITPIQVVQNNRSILYCEGVDVIDAETGTLTPPISIGQGGTGAVTASAALANLGGVPTIREVNTAALSGLAGGGDLTIDRNLLLDADNLTVELVIDTFADVIAFYDDSAGAMRKAPFDAFVFNLVPVSTLPDTMLRSNGAGAWEESSALEISSGPPRVEANTTLRCHSSLRVITSGLTINDYLNISGFNTVMSVVGSGTVDQLTFSGWDFLELDGPSLKFFEQASAPAGDEASYSQFYVRNDAFPVLIHRQDDGNEVPICEEGSFTVDFDIGFTGANVVTIQYIRIGNMVHCTMPISNLGNSNAGTLGTGADWPVALRPASTRYGTGPVTDNNGAAITIAQLTLTSGGVLSFFAPSAATIPNFASTWTASGVKGVIAGWSWSYRITDS